VVQQGNLCNSLSAAIIITLVRYPSLRIGNSALLQVHKLESLIEVHCYSIAIVGAGMKIPIPFLASTSEICQEDAELPLVFLPRKKTSVALSNVVEDLSNCCYVP